MFVDCCLMVVVYWLVIDVGCSLLVVRCLLVLFVVCWYLRFGDCSLLRVCWLLFAVCCLFGVCCSLLVFGFVAVRWLLCRCALLLAVCVLRFVRRRSLFVGCWLLYSWFVVGCWLLRDGCPLCLGMSCLLLVAG